MNTHLRWALVLILVAVVAFGIGTAAAQDKSWVGENVLQTKPAKDIKFGDRLGEKRVEYPFSGVWPFKVREEKDGWLRLHDGKHEGWVDKTDFVLAREAFAYFDGRVRANPKDSFALNMRGGYWLEKKDFDKAIADFSAGIQLNAKDSNAFNNRGFAWAGKKEYDKAIADYTEAVQINPKNSVAYSNRAFTYRTKLDFDKAIADYDEAIRLEPRFVNALYGRGASWRAKKVYDKAIKDFDEVIKVDPKHVSAFNDRGIIRADKKEYEQAIKDYDEALRLNAKSTYTYFNRAICWKATKHFDKAIQDYEQTLRLDPKYARAMINLSWILATCPEEKLRDGKRAVELATKACEVTNWKEPSYIDVLASAYAEVGQFDQAIRYEKQALTSAAFEKTNGVQAHKRLKLYEQNQPFRE